MADGYQADDRYRNLFVDESAAHLQHMTDALLALEQNPDGSSVIQDIFRSAHTLKGMSATMGFEGMSELTHALENGLAMARDGNIEIDHRTTDSWLAAVSTLEMMLQSIAEGGSGEDIDTAAVLAALREAADPEVQRVEKARPEMAVAQDEKVQRAWREGSPVWGVKVTFTHACEMPAVRAFLLLRELGNAGDILWSSPSTDEIEQGICGKQLHIAWTGSGGSSTIGDAVRSVDDIASHEVDELMEDPKGSEASSSTKAGPSNGSAQTSSKQASATPELMHMASMKTRSLRVEVEQLDQLMNLVSEFVIHRTHVEQLTHANASQSGATLTEAVAQLTRVGDELQGVVLGMRMIAIDAVFQRFPRMVRDVARSLGKEVELVIEGADTELEKSLIDEIGDPLVHLLRNSLDHGLETPSEREASGKSPVGRLLLSASRIGQRVRIEIADDGRGIQRDSVRRKLVERGWLDDAVVSQMMDDELYAYLFEPGFSTANQVSSLSGRGVGLDVVRQKINALSGDIRVVSEEGQGSRWIIELPMTLSIVDALLVGVASDTYALPLSDIYFLDTFLEADVKVHAGRETVPYSGARIPLVRLGREFYGMEHKHEAEVIRAVVVRSGERRAALEVNSYLGQQEVVQKPLGSWFATTPPGISGATILGTGDVALILDGTYWIANNRFAG